jgi:hypothetical protein
MSLPVYKNKSNSASLVRKNIYFWHETGHRCKKSQDIAGEGPQKKLYKAGKKTVDNGTDW